MLSDYFLLTFILLLAMFLSVKTKKLDTSAAITGGVLGFCIYAGAGFGGITIVGVFFILGSAATSWKMNLKEAIGVHEKNKGRRTAGQVLANAGVAGIAGCLTLFFPEQAYLLRLMLASSIASATADTLSSELGNIYGKSFYNIISFRKDSRGGNGVVSLEGTLLGIAGSLIITIVYSICFGWNILNVYILFAGTVGNISDSVLGATLERRNYLNNNAVNFLNTLIAALVPLLLY